MMKILRYMFLSVLMAFGLVSCSENEREYFDSSYSALNIWLGSANSVSDSVIYNYSYYVGEGTVPFQVRVTGVPVDYDREFVLEAFDGDIAEAEGSYTLQTYVLPAGEITASFAITFNSAKLKNPNSFKTTDGHLRLRVRENNSFSTGVGELSVLNIVLKNDISKPTTWDDGVYYTTYANYFGAYSRAKYQFMIEILGYMDFTIVWGAAMGYDEENNSITSSYATVLAQYLQQKLDEYNETHPMLVDDSGEPISFL